MNFKAPCQFALGEWHGKFFRVMKLTTALILIAGLQVAAKGYTQESITLSEKNSSLKEIFKKIEKQTDYFFVYRTERLSGAKNVSIDVKDATLTQVLETVLKDQPFTYTIIEKTIVVQPKIETSNEQAISEPPIDIKGRVVNEKGEPVEGATVSVKGTKNATATDANGFFTLKGVDENATLIITGVNIDSYEVKVNNKTDLATLSVKTKVTTGEDITVKVNTGYQEIPKERATGSFDFINNDLLNRRVSTNIIDRIESLTTAVFFDRRSNANNPKLTIRGRGTIYANPDPLIILDNFPYNGDINNINPKDIESITVLKDAAAASIWGVRAGNGVIVIITKKGIKNQPLKMELNTSVTMGQKPDLFYQPLMATTDFIDVEKTLFDQGFYFNDTASTSKPPISPVVEILLKKRNGVITQQEADNQINALRNYDVRNDLLRYFYRKSVNQQYNLNVRGGADKYTYFFSAGFDRNLSSLVNNDFNRFTLNAKQLFIPVKNLEISATMVYTQSRSKLDDTRTGISTGGPSNRLIYPYARLADDQGKALPIVKDYRQSFKDATKNLGFLNWDFIPLNELNYSDNTTRLTDNRINVGIKYLLARGVSAEIKYQFEKQLFENIILNSQETYFTRNLINKYTTVSGTTLTRNIPLGDILFRTNNTLRSNAGRAQLNFDRKFHKHVIAGLAGFEAREDISEGNGNFFYGYDVNLGNHLSVNYNTSYTLYPTGSGFIPTTGGLTKIIERYRSYYANAAYIYNSRYIFSVSGRIDQSNLFGVRTNQKSAPLWSAGIKWDLDKEDFYKIGWIPLMKIRMTYGYNGNVDQTVTAFTTALRVSNTALTNQPAALIGTPPNPDLRWEKNRMMNLGIDFGIKNNVLTGSIEFYRKKGIDLIGEGPLDPTSGFSSYRGNLANMKGSGWDIQLNSVNVKSKNLSWHTTFIFSYTSDEVTKWLVSPSFAGYFADASLGTGTGISISPTVGKPLFGIYSLKWAGLDPATGDPRGYLNGQPSTNYSSLISTIGKTVDSLIYHGRALPSVFGALRNNVELYGFSISFNITYKFNYYFRRSSINYNSLFTRWSGHKDYAKRWQKPGDENFTNVPSMIYPANSARDDFYARSEVLVEKGDNIRLQDISLSYNFRREVFKKIPFQNIQLYMYANNLGILWKANKSGIDPDFPTLPNPRTYSVGIRTNF